MKAFRKASMSSCKGVCRDCEHAERTSVWEQYWCTREDSTYYDCRRNGDEYCKAFEGKAFNMTKWTDRLPADVYNRLCACHSIKKDIPILVNCKWAAMQEAGKDKEGFTKEDALVFVLDWLDSNSQWIDLTREEYDALKA